LQLWHLFHRVDWLALLSLGLMGSAGILWSVDELRIGFSEFWHKGKTAVVYSAFVALLAIVWMSNQAIGPPENYDTGLYHLNAIRWNATYPIVPGLGNLHGRLAFNNSSFLYLAMLDSGPWKTMSRHVGNGLLILVLLAQILLSLPKACQLSRPSWIWHFFLILVLLPTLVIAHFDASSGSTEVAVFVLAVFITSQLLTLFFALSDASYDDRLLVFSICFLSAVGVTVKLSFLAFGFATAALALGLHVACRTVQERRGRRSILPAVAISVAIVLVPYLTRSVILSGYLMYPSTIGPFPVDWRIPEPHMQAMQNSLYNFARRPGVHSSSVPWTKALWNWDWFGPWTRAAIGNRAQVQVPLALAGGGGLVVLYHAVFIGLRNVPWRSWLVTIPVSISLVFWFFTAPDLRYLNGSSWILGGLILSLSLHQLRRTGLANRVCAATVYLVVAVVILFAARYMYSALVGPGPYRGFHPTPTVALRQFTTSSGLVVLTPDRSDQSWDAPLPTTPVPVLRLRLRREGDLSSGFRIDPSALD
jgi:hypothetical protein